MKITKRNSAGQIARGSGLKHGLSDDPIYDCWVAMRARCSNADHPSYGLYGGRGVRVCDSWATSFTNFLADMGNKPTSSHTLDRIDVNGDYEPGNCRWITHHQQQLNRRNNNPVPGVHFERQRGRWHADITIRGKKIFLGRYADYGKAIEARKRAEVTYGIC